MKPEIRHLEGRVGAPSPTVHKTCWRAVGGGAPTLPVKIWLFLGICCLLFGVSACRSTKPPPEPPIAIEQRDRVMTQAAALSEQGNWTAAAVEWRRAADRASLLNDQAGEAIALHNLAQAQRQLSQFDTARTNALAAAELNEKLARKNEWWHNQILLLQLE